MGPASFAAEQLRPMLSVDSFHLDANLLMHLQSASGQTRRLSIAKHPPAYPSKAVFEARLESMFGTLLLVSLIKPVQLDHGSDVFRC